jgi:hypothetical protein
MTILRTGREVIAAVDDFAGARREVVDEKWVLTKQ